MREEVIKIYRFSELDPKVQEKVIEQFQQEDWLYGWQDENNETLKAFEGIFPVKVRNWEYGGGRTDINFKFLIDEEHKNLTGIRLMKYIINNYGRYLWKQKYLKHVKGKARYSRIQKETDCVLTGYYIDNYILDPIYEFLKKPKEGVTFEDILRDCLWSWVRECERDWGYAYSRENIEEMLEANDYEFTVGGGVWR